MRKFITASLAGVALLMAGCSTSNPDVISRGEAQQLQSVRPAVVESVRLVRVDGSQSGAGALAGAAIGGISGGSFSGTRTPQVASIVLGVGGAVLGNAIERATTSEDAVELVLRFPNNTRQAIVQGRGAQVFKPGDMVQVIGSGSKLRVVKD